MIIRKYKTSDEEAIKQIHFETGFIGKSMCEIITLRQHWDDEIKHYFKHPEDIFVADENGRVVGYLLGCLDDSRMHRNFFFVRHALGKAVLAFFMPKKDRQFWFSRLGFLMNVILSRSEELKMKCPKNAGHIHINLLSDYRGKGAGTKLLETFFRYAKKQGVRIIHADSFQSRLNPNANFWLKNNFTEYSKIRTLYWEKSLSDEKIFFVCYVKTL